VFDDSPKQEGKAVVSDLNDNRLIYKPHPQNLGRSGNIDHCFHAQAYREASYAFVLEDDNYLLPDFIASNIQVLEEQSVSIVLRNQEIRLEQNGSSIETNTTTRGKWFSTGEYGPIALYARLFFCEGISNGGLFWDTETITSDLQVGAQVEHSWHQELFRTLKIKEPIYFEETPLCIFTQFEYHHKRFNFAPKHNRATQAILIYLVKRYGQEIIREANQIATTASEEALLEEKMLNALYIGYPFTQTNRFKRLKVFSKSFARYLLYRNPFKQILTA